MINFETMTVAQMKKYLSPKVLQKLSTPELGRLLSAARSVRDFFAQKGGLDASLEAAYWNVAEKEIVKEFKNRNYNVYITNFNDVFSALNSLLAEKDNPDARKRLATIVARAIQGDCETMEACRVELLCHGFSFVV